MKKIVISVSIIIIFFIFIGVFLYTKKPTQPSSKKSVVKPTIATSINSPTLPPNKSLLITITRNPESDKYNISKAEYIEGKGTSCEKISNSTEYLDLSVLDKNTNSIVTCSLNTKSIIHIDLPPEMQGTEESLIVEKADTLSIVIDANERFYTLVLKNSKGELIDTKEINSFL